MPGATGRKAMAAQLGGVFCGAAAQAGLVRPMSAIKPAPAILFITVLPLCWSSGLPVAFTRSRWLKRPCGQRVPWFCPHSCRECRPMRSRAPLLFAATLLLLGAAPATRAETVDTALVLALDVSLSVDEHEYALQRDGIAAAFESPALMAAVAGGKNHAIDVLVLEWSDPEIQTISVVFTRASAT